MAGTVHDILGRGSYSNVVFISGSTVTANYIYRCGPNTDERVVSVNTLNNQEVIIVSLLRDLTSQTNQGDRILITRVDLLGNVIGSKILSGTQNNYNIYPKHSIISQNNNTLYICGYISEYAGTAQEQATTLLYRTPKHSFVLAYDLLSNSVVNTRRFESNINQGYDADMANRMQFLSNGDLFVTGSAMINGTNLGALMLSLDPLTLLPNFAKTVGSNANTVGRFIPHEYGFALQEAADGSGYYIFSNYTLQFDGQSSDVPRTQGFAITKVDQNFDILPTGNSRAEWRSSDFITGINIIDGIHPDLSRRNTNVVLSCHTSNPPGSYSGGSSGIINQDHIAPVLTELNLSTNASNDIVVNTAFLRALPTMAGTGAAGAQPNSFLDLGGFYSSTHWSPVTTVRDLSTGSTDITLNAPIWNTTANTLALKHIRTDENGYVPGGCPTDDVIPSYTRLQPVVGRPILDDPFQIVTIDNNLSGILWTTDHLYACTSSYYRGSNTTNSIIGGKGSLFTNTKVYPNPANDQIKISLGSKIQNSSSPTTISLCDMSGKQVMSQELCKDCKEGVLSTYSIPQGTYLVKVQNETVSEKPTLIVITH